MKSQLYIFAHWNSEIHCLCHSADGAWRAAIESCHGVLKHFFSQTLTPIKVVGTTLKAMLLFLVWSSDLQNNEKVKKKGLSNSNQLTFVPRYISFCKALQKEFLTYWADVHRKDVTADADSDRSNLISRALVNAAVLSSFGEIQQINIQPENTVTRLVQTERWEQNKRLDRKQFIWRTMHPRAEDALLMWLLPETLSFQPDQWFSVFHQELLNNPPDKRQSDKLTL